VCCSPGLAPSLAARSPTPLPAAAHLSAASAAACCRRRFECAMLRSWARRSMRYVESTSMPAEEMWTGAVDMRGVNRRGVERRGVNRSLWPERGCGCVTGGHNAYAYASRVGCLGGRGEGGGAQCRDEGGAVSAAPERVVVQSAGSGWALSAECTESGEGGGGEKS
jgi:hypothetical protein